MCHRTDELTTVEMICFVPHPTYSHLPLKIVTLHLSLFVCLSVSVSFRVSSNSPRSAFVRNDKPNYRWHARRVCVQKEGGRRRRGGKKKKKKTATTWVTRWTLLLHLSQEQPCGQMTAATASPTRENNTAPGHAWRPLSLLPTGVAAEVRDQYIDGFL